VNRQWCPLGRLAEILGDGWSLLILREVACGPQRFKALKNQVSGISMDQLTRKLEALTSNGIISRNEYKESPPRVEYSLTESGLSFIFILKKLLIWSNENLWSAKKEDETLDIALHLRVMAAFFGQGFGLVEIRIRNSNGMTRYFLEKNSIGKVSVSDQQDSREPSVKVDLQEEMWVDLISRPQEIKNLSGKITGDRKVLDQLLPIFLGKKFSQGALTEYKIQTTSPAATL